MNNFGSAQPFLNILWQYVVFPAFHVIQNIKFAGITLVSLLLGFFFIRLCYRYIILPLVGSGDHLTDKANSIKSKNRGNDKQ